MARFLVLTFLAYASVIGGAPAADPAPAASSAPIPSERSVVSHSSARIGGRVIDYTATAGTILLRDAKHDPVASMFYVAYTTGERGRRPISFIYNGGPGSSSVWLHMGAFGPKRVVTSNATTTPGPPYGLTDNESSLLDKSDLVFVDAVGAGYSMVVGNGKGKDFWGLDEDAASFAQFIRRYITLTNRWNAPKFLIGESYGTTRSALLVRKLQDDGIYCNGVVLISSVLNFHAIDFVSGPGDDLQYVVFLPTQAAVAWYHQVLPNRTADLRAFLAEVRRFATGDYASALMAGSRLDPARRAAIVAKLHAYTGLSQAFIELSDLRISPRRFEQELLRTRRRNVGRLDARYLGIEPDPTGDSPSYDPTQVALNGAFTAAFNDYAAGALNFRSDREYKTLNYEIGGQWNWLRGGEGSRHFPNVNVSGDLADALTTNPHLHVFSANGYFDLATPFYGTDYTLDHLKLDPSIRSNITYGYYESGHMIYLETAAREQLKRDLSAFYDTAVKQATR